MPVELICRRRTALVKMGLYQKIIDSVFRPMHLGRLEMTCPNGHTLQYGSGLGGVSAQIDVRNEDFFKKCVLFGDVGFGESYVDGDWETPDIAKVIEWMIINVEHHPTLMSNHEKRSPVNFLKFCNTLLGIYRKNSVSGSRKNISAHYDLGNDFYQLILDPSMTYSAAYFRNERITLEHAQYRKYEELCRKLQIKSTDHVLEIGSGWGGFSLYAARNFGCRVTTVTVSAQQFKYAQEQIVREGLGDRISIQLKDYRHLSGQYDKLASIEMLEAVGHDYFPAYFHQCSALLKPNGLLGLQVILSPDHRYESFKNNVDWIQKHIFPGSLLPSFAEILRNINGTGTFNLFDYEDMTFDYVQTLGHWRRNLNAHRAEIQRLGMDEAFLRKWNYYLCYCMAAFKTRNIYVAQMVFSRPNNMELNP